VFYLRKPNEGALVRELRASSGLPLTYEPVGGTISGPLPPSFPHNQHDGVIGRGAASFQRARAALHRWAMYDVAWTTLCWPSVAPEVDAEVGILAKHHGIWSFNPVRVVYVVDVTDPEPTFGFAIGTLPGHSERGEERFTVSLKPDGEVLYSLRSFARGQQLLARLTPPLVRYYQRRFGRESVEAMRRAVQG
jgi:uncharacterized protein (UPF0548 family)